MNITCPRCGFSREISPDRLPARAVIATCPHCACRFRFTPETEMTEHLPGSPSVKTGTATPDYMGSPTTNAQQTASTGTDTSLPSEAVIPGRHGNETPAAPDGPARQASEGSLHTEKHLSPGDKPDSNPSSVSDAHTVSDQDTRSDAVLSPAGHDTMVNPWDAAPAPDGWIAAFYQTCLRVMFGAPLFFSRLNPKAPQVRALFFYLIISVIQAVVEWIWTGILLSLMAPNTATDPELGRMLEMLSPKTSLPLLVLLKTGFSVAQLYILATLLHFTFGFVAKPRPEFSSIFQITAYAAAPCLLCIVPLLGSIAGFIWMVACLLVGLRAAMGLSWAQTLAGFIPVVVLLTPLLFQMLSVAQG